MLSRLWTALTDLIGAIAYLARSVRQTGNTMGEIDSKLREGAGLPPQGRDLPALTDGTPEDEDAAEGALLLRNGRLEKIPKNGKKVPK